MSNIVEFVNNQCELFNSSITDEKIVWAKESQFAIQLFQSNEMLAKTAMSNPTSAQNAIVNIAAIGITLNPASKLAYLVPRGGAVCLDISYLGLMHLAMATGSIMWGQCKLVHEADTYESTGLGVAPIHKYNAFSKRGSVVGGYCTVKTSGGDFLTEEMSLDDIIAIQKTSKSQNGPWKNHWNEMARKTIVKRASKYWPKVDRLDNAIHHLNTEGGEGFQDEKHVSGEFITPDQCEEIKAACSAKNIGLDVLCRKAQVDCLESIKFERFAGAMGWINKQVVQNDNS